MWRVWLLGELAGAVCWAGQQGLCAGRASRGCMSGAAVKEAEGCRVFWGVALVYEWVGLIHRGEQNQGARIGWLVVNSG